jgi:hypothetical protein
VRAFVEADMEHGVRAFPIEELEGLHLRICRPMGLSSQGAGRLGDKYDLKTYLISLAIYCPHRRFRRHGVGECWRSAAAARRARFARLDRRGVRSSRLSNSSDHRLNGGCCAGLPRSRTRSRACSPLPLIRPTRLRRLSILHDHQAEPMPRLSFFNMVDADQLEPQRQEQAPRVRPRRTAHRLRGVQDHLIPTERAHSASGRVYGAASHFLLNQLAGFMAGCSAMLPVSPSSIWRPTYRRLGRRERRSCCCRRSWGCNRTRRAAGSMSIRDAGLAAGRDTD